MVPLARHDPERVVRDGDEVGPLVARAADGDDDAWRRLIGLYGRRVFAMARSRVRDDDLAEEITQSVFATIATKLTRDAYDERGRFESWLFRITMNRVRDEFRRLKRHATPTDPAQLAESGAAHDRAGTDRAELSALRNAMDALGDADREIIELRHHAQMSFKQISAVLGEPVGTLLARHHRALKKLKDTVEPGAQRAAAAADQRRTP